MEFDVSKEVIGLVIGKEGANIQKVTKDTGVERINVDTTCEPCKVSDSIILMFNLYE